MNCLSELVEATGGHIDMSQLPVGDPTLSAKEIVGNESQERMGLLMKEEDVARVQRIADRERSPMYVVGETTNDMKFVFEHKDGMSRRREFIIFVVLSVIGLILNDGIVLALNKELSIEANVAKIAATALVMIYNFVTRKILLDGTSSQ